MLKADLHIHSHYSDSDLSVEDIFSQAKRENIKAIAITDHDTIDGVRKGGGLSKRYGVEFIEGIELSSYYNGSEVHILGYFVDIGNKNFLKVLKGVKDLRQERLIKMAEKVNSLGMKIDIDELVFRLNEKIATRLHLALYMLEKKQVDSVWEAFKKYLSPGKPAYVGGFKFSVQEAITLIKEACGIAVLAHPHLLFNKEWIKEFIDYGLDGIEVFYPKVTSQLVDYYQNIADRYGLFKCGGSDSHGSYKKFTRIGEITIPYDWVEKLKDGKRSLLHKRNI